MRPSICRWLLLALYGTLVTGLAPLQADPKRPNILLVVSDDHGFGDVSWNTPGVATPNLERLARMGIRLDRFYANPICSVTRAALLTGLATRRTGVNNSSGLDRKYTLLPQRLHEAGYQTWLCGKWHLGGAPDSERNGPEYLPMARGFDHFYGHLHGAIDYTTHRRKDRDELDWQRNGKPVDEEGFSTDLLADEMIRLIQSRDKDRPFFGYLAFNAVHGPLQPPPGEKNANRRGGKRPLLLANLQYFDAALGRVIAALEKEGLQEETLVLFLGDNGGQLSQGASNGELRGEKGTVYEGGLRVPALVCWPGHLPAGRISTDFSCAMDVWPTLCEAVGLAPGRPPQEFDGQSVWQAWQTGEAGKRTPFVMGIREVACFDPPWKLVQGAGRDGEAELFHLVDDPNEKHNVADQNPEIVTRLTQALRSIPVGDSGRRRRNADAGAPRPPKGQKPRKRGGAQKQEPANSDSSGNEGGTRQ
jgi:arylsulfatase A-like enzyme